jgi:hypothetical protein
MDCVSTRHFVRRKSGTEQIFLTDWAVTHVLARLAVVIIKQQGVDAHATVITVSEVLPTTHAAKATVFTVIGRLLVGHPQVANTAIVSTELYTAIDAVVAVDNGACV